MNVFVLCAGRCGSTTFARAASHMSNYSSGHESRAKLLGKARLAYSRDHIEADNRLTWMLGRLDEEFGVNAFYVHLTRNTERTVLSLDQRWKLRHGIMPAYRDGILSGVEADPVDICADYVATVNTNIRFFLKDKPLKMDFPLESALQLWRIFWERIGAEGDFEASLAEWRVKHNATPPARSIFRRVFHRADALLFARG
jgi:hypothetical protein